MPRKYGKKVQEEVENEMHKYKLGTAHSGRKHRKVKSRKQAIAIGLSKARKKGGKVPKKPSKSTGKQSGKRSGRKSGKRSSSRSW